MDLDNDEVAYTRYFREIRAYKELGNINLQINSDTIENIEILRNYFKENFNKKVSKNGVLK